MQNFLLLYFNCQIYHSRRQVNISPGDYVTSDFDQVLMNLVRKMNLDANQMICYQREL